MEDLMEDMEDEVVEPVYVVSGVCSRQKKYYSEGDHKYRLKKGRSYCQYANCPKHRVVFDIKKMISYSYFVFHSKTCVKNFIKENGRHQTVYRTALFQAF